MQSIIHRLIDRMDDAAAIPDDKRDQDQSLDHKRAAGGVMIALRTMIALISPKALLENTESRTLLQPVIRGSDGEKLSVTNLLVKARLSILPVARRIWEAIAQLGVRTFVTIMEGKAEESSVAAPPAAPDVYHPASRPNPVADSARINQLIDMGFAREAAEFALIRSRNDVAAAADLILSMPHLFRPPARDVAGPAAPAAPAEDRPSSPEEETTDTGPTEPPTGANENRMDVDGTAATGASSSSILKELDLARSECRADMSTRAVVLLDRHAEAVAFGLLPAFSNNLEGVSYLLDQISELAVGHEYDNQVALSARIHLLALLIQRRASAATEPQSISRAHDVLASLRYGTPSQPGFAPVILLFAQTLLAASHTITEVKVGDDPLTPVLRTIDVSDRVFESLENQCMGILSEKELKREDIMSALLLLVILTRRSPLSIANFSIVLKAFHQPFTNLRGCHPYHAFEDSRALRGVMWAELRLLLPSARDEAADVGGFASRSRPAAYRKPELVLDFLQEECALVNPTPSQSAFHIRDKHTKITRSSEAAMPNPSEGASDDTQRRLAIDHILSELWKAVGLSQGRTAEGSTPSPGDAEAAHDFAGLLLSLLTELLGSYTSVRETFMSSIRQHGHPEVTKTEGGFISFVSDLVCCVSLQEDLSGDTEGVESRDFTRRTVLSGWAISMIVALCADITATNGGEDPDKSREALVVIRKTVLDTIAKAIKDTSAVDLASRYGKLCTLGRLVCQLLLAQASSTDRRLDESNQSMAKMMLEKNFVSLLTTAVGQIDHHFPCARTVSDSLLLAMEHL